MFQSTVCCCRRRRRYCWWLSMSKLSTSRRRCNEVNERVVTSTTIVSSYFLVSFLILQKWCFSGFHEAKKTELERKTERWPDPFLKRKWEFFETVVASAEVFSRERSSPDDAETDRRRRTPATPAPARSGRGFAWQDLREIGRNGSWYRFDVDVDANVAAL